MNEVRTKMDESIPRSMAPFFQEYDLDKLDLVRNSQTIIERTLQYGNRDELAWLFQQYDRGQVADWVRRLGARRLFRRNFDFWRLMLDVDDAEDPFKGADRIWPH